MPERHDREAPAAPQGTRLIRVLRAALVALALAGATVAPAVAHPAEARVEQVTGHRASLAELRFCRLAGAGAPFVACVHATEGHRQWNHGQGTPGHTWARYRQEARQLRRFINGLIRPTCTGPGDCPALIRTAFDRQGIGWRGSEAVAVATCESGLRPGVRGGGGGNYAGLFQQWISAWPGRAARWGFAGASPFDPWANAMVSAAMVREDGDWGQWACQP